MYNSLVERCFKECVESFRKKDLDNTEEKVSLGCSRPFNIPLPPSQLSYQTLIYANQFSLSSPLQCVQSCCEKFMKHSARVGMRFGELSSAADAQMNAVVQGQTGK